MVHLLTPSPSRQGEGVSPITSRTEGIDLVNDPFPLVGVPLRIRFPAPPAAVALQPHGTELPFTYRDGQVHLTVDLAEGHGMVVLREEVAPALR